jgi:1,2-phenylacetyl-CoA epoxidase PaaB subunit
MPVPSEVRRVQAAIDNNNRKELEWSLWYARMRQSVPSARPADVKYWSAIERQVQEKLEPPVAAKVYPTRKKKREDRGLGLSPLSKIEEADSPTS